MIENFATILTLKESVIIKIVNFKFEKYFISNGSKGGGGWISTL